MVRMLAQTGIKDIGHGGVSFAFECGRWDEAMEVLDDSGADAVLLDYRMPGIDGITLLAELRRREFRGRCILISAYLNEEVRSQAGHLGVDLVLKKPVDISRLRSALTGLLPQVGVRPAGLGA